MIEPELIAAATREATDLEALAEAAKEWERLHLELLELKEKERLARARLVEFLPSRENPDGYPSLKDMRYSKTARVGFEVARLKGRPVNYAMIARALWGPELQISIGRQRVGGIIRELLRRKVITRLGRCRFDVDHELLKLALVSWPPQPSPKDG